MGRRSILMGWEATLAGCGGGDMGPPFLTCTVVYSVCILVVCILVVCILVVCILVVLYTKISLQTRHETSPERTVNFYWQSQTAVFCHPY